MQSLLLISNAVLLLLLTEAARRILCQRSEHRRIELSYRSRLMELEGTFDSPIPVLKVDEFHELFAQSGLGQGLSLESEVSFVGGGVLGGTSHFETWVLSVLAKRAATLFEFGTGTGRIAYLWARNSAPDARVITLTLGKNQHADYQFAREDNPLAVLAALAESAFDRFLYSGTQAEHKITQLFGDSKRFDETPYLKECDLIFIDGSHAYSYVKSDTEKALRMLREGGLVLWHDYRFRNLATSGVRRYLDELSETLPLVRLHDTAFVVYRKGTNSEH